jgi:isopentenyl phosphate kinase
MKIEPTVLKLGGSVITKKGEFATPNLDAIERLANEIFQANVSFLILVHGGGSFGHPIAEKYRISEGYKEQSQIIGFVETHLAMMKLNNLVMDALIRHNVSAMVVQPSSFLMTTSGRIKKMDIRLIKKMLKMKIMPVLFGDAVLDSERGFTILSGDQLVSSLAIELGASNIIMGGDVDGVFTTDPKESSSAKLITRLCLENLQDYHLKIGGSKVSDVTGGMIGKIQELIPAINQNIPSLIVNATKPLRILNALRGKKVISTLIEKGETNE